MATDFDRDVTPIRIQDVKRIVVYIWHRLLWLDVIVVSHIPYARLRAQYQARRDLLYGYVEAAGFVAWKPRGAYYILTDVAHFLKRYGVKDDTAFAMWLIENVGVATVPGSSFYAHPELGRTKIRFCFPKTDDVLRDAGERLLKIRS